MEIAALPVPYFSPPVPQAADTKPTQGKRSDLSPRQGNTGSPSERVLQGEVLGNGRRKTKPDSSERYTFEQRSRREQADLSALDPDAQIAIRSYLDIEDSGVTGYNTRSLIDVYA